MSNTTNSGFKPNFSKKSDKKNNTESVSGDTTQQQAKESDNQEFGGPKGLEPTRYGDWERKGRCVDF